MECPGCQAPTRILETRRAEEGAAIRRRRECRSCGHRFTTFERLEREPLTVIKRDGAREEFDGSKLRGALERAAHKRPVEGDQIEALVKRVAASIRDAGGELRSEHLAETCLEGLRELDLGAYLQYAGVDFADPDAIRAELARLSGGGSSALDEKPANRRQTGDGFRPGRVGSSVVPPKIEREESV